MNLKFKLFIVGGVILTFIVILSLWLSSFEKEYDIRKSIVIEKPTKEIFDYILEFNHWIDWSPWLIMERNAEVTVSSNSTNEGSYYAWKGKLVGEGTITHKRITINKQIDQEIAFKKPFRSRSKVYWKFNPSQDNTNQTIVTWGMLGSMPFLFRFLTPQMKIFIGMDYERGLRMLKEKIETGSISTKVDVLGKITKNNFLYIGIKGEDSLSNIGKNIGNNFKILKQYVAENNLKENTAFFPFTIYHEFDFQSSRYAYTTAIPLNKNSQTNSSTTNNLFFDSIPAASYLKIIHTGDYKHLGNAWTTGENYLRTYKIKRNKNMSPLEVYLTNPEEVTNKDKWITEIYFPIKD